ncbi:MAG: aldose epimerase family protein [Massiliimalia sp.]|jgi:aldose 1-epimerase
MTTITSKDFGTVYDGQKVTLYTLSNGTMEVDIMSYGATLVAIRTPDQNGKITDVLCGWETVADYQKHGGYLGAVIGRNGNRIGHAKFVLNGKEYQLGANDGNNNLHGGPDGFDNKVWNVMPCGERLVCKYYSPDMESGYPANLDVTVTYTLSDDNELGLEYFAVSDGDTVANFTNHAYFNLGGHDQGSIVDHKLKLYADFYTPVDDDCCPTGEVKPVKGTVFDFTDFRRIGDDIDNVPDFAITGGYDHNFVLNTRENQMGLAAEAICEKTGIKMEVYTNKPAIQFYAGNMMDEDAGKGGAFYHKRDGFCMETQVSPNCLAHPHLGNSILRKGELYHDKTVYRFTTVK